MIKSRRAIGEFDQGEIEAFEIGFGVLSERAFLITGLIGNAFFGLGTV